MIKIDNVTKYYKNYKAINKINLEINKGEVFGFIGPNGAGKSTTINCIMNLINSNKGNIYIDNILVCNKNYNVQKDIGFLPSTVSLYEDLTVDKMLKYSASFYDDNLTSRKAAWNSSILELRPL